MTARTRAKRSASARRAARRVNPDELAEARRELERRRSVEQFAFEQFARARQRGSMAAIQPASQRLRGAQLGVEVWRERVARLEKAAAERTLPAGPLRQLRLFNPAPWGWAYNERTGYYDVTLNGKAAGPRMLRFGELRKAMAYARTQNERAAMAERAATWPTRPASHVQARLFNPAPRRRR
jgi:hypothetical protein